MKRLLSYLLTIFLSTTLYAQGFNADKMALANFITRMYKHAPFEVKVVQDYDDSYLVSAVLLDPAKYNGNESAMLRVAGVKAMSQASRYFNGANISADLIITTTEQADGTANTEIIEKIIENSVGYVKQLEQINTFDTDDGQKVFIYAKKID